MAKTQIPQDRLRRIEGRHNPQIKELRRAFSQSELTAEGYCAIEGVKIVEEAVRSGLHLHSVFFSDAAENRMQKLLPQLGAKVETLVLPDSLFSSAVPSESPQGVAALVRLKEFSLEDVLARAHAGPLLVIAGLQDPGNLGTILRSAEAFGAAGVVLVEGTVSPFNSKVVRASAGSVFRLPIVQSKASKIIEPLRKQGIRMLATSSHKGISLPEAKLVPPVAIFIGSEGAGLPRELMGAIDEIVVIPHSDKVESLNAGVAASIVLYELARQRS